MRRSRMIVRSYKWDASSSWSSSSYHHHDHDEGIRVDTFEGISGRGQARGVFRCIITSPSSLYSLLNPILPSTASSILPSAPRNALLLPHMVVIVDKDTHVILEHMETTPVIWSKPLMIWLISDGRCISIRHVVVKPASTAAWVAIAE